MRIQNFALVTSVTALQRYSVTGVVTVVTIVTVTKKKGAMATHNT
jgi:hypothetical protein